MLKVTESLAPVLARALGPAGRRYGNLDTGENQGNYPQAGTQAADAGFPLALIVPSATSPTRLARGGGGARPGAKS